MKRCENDVCGLDKFKKVVQLHDKDKFGKEYQIFPITYTYAVYDKNGASLESMLAQFNNVFLQYQGTAMDTRLLLPKEMRRKGVQISYRNMDDEVVTEKCVNDTQSDNDHWGLDANWMRIDELSLQGEISVSSKGTWVINGEDTGIKALGPKGDNGLTPWMKTIDNKLHYSYDNKTWVPVSDYISAWFRFTGTPGSSQAGNIGKIQISRDNGKTWADLSGEFTNDLKIRGYRTSVELIPAGQPQGAIWGIGPTYEESDTEHTNPIYRLYVKDGNGWVDNGRFTGIAAGVVQELGESETEVVSQKTVTGIYRKYIAEMSFSGIVRIEPNKLCNISSEGIFTDYIDNDLYDTAWVQIYSEESDNLLISGAKNIRTNFFSSFELTTDSFISQIVGDKPVIPEKAVLACITLAKADNPQGYDLLRVDQPGIPYSKKETEVSVKGDLFINSGGYLRADTGDITPNSNYSYTPYLPITGKDDITIIGGYNTTDIEEGIVTPLCFYDKERVFISAYMGETTKNKTYFFPKTSIPANARFIRSCRNNTITSPQNSTVIGCNISALLNKEYSDTFSEDNTVGFSAEGAKLISVAYDNPLTDGFLKKTDGNVGVPTGNDLVVTDFIELNKNFDIIMTGYESKFASKLCFYDKTKVFISSLDEVSVPTNFRNYRISKSDFPENAYYIRATYRKEYSSNSYIFNTSISYVSSEVKKIKLLTDYIKNNYIKKITGKNLLFPEDFLYGVTYSASTGLIENENGILSNKLRLRPGVYSVQGVKPYHSVPTTVRICCFDDKDQLIRADAITLDSNGIGNYTVKAGGSVGNNSYVAYWRLVLQFDKQVLFDESLAQFEYNSEPTEVEPCKFSLIEKPLITPRTVLMTGASSSMPGNGYFETACEMLGFKAYNRAISGDSVMQHATKIWRGELYTPEELEEIDILVTSHIHNYDVCFEGKVFEKVETTYGYYDIDGTFTPSSTWACDKYNLSPGDTELVISTITQDSGTPHALFFDRNNTLIGYDIVMAPIPPALTPIIDREVTVPENSAYVLVKRRYNTTYETKVRGKGYDILCKTVEEYESKGYDENNNPLTVPLDKNNPNHRIVPYGGQGAAGAQFPNHLYDERYSAGYDYLLKKYAKDCYDLRLNPNSKWYGTKSGKPVIIVCTTQWHDGYVRFNESIARLCKKHGAILCDVAGNIGFSYKQTDPENPDSIRWNALHCNNTAIGSGNDTETIPINGINYTNMGWHPTRDWGCYIQMKRANILADTLKCATYNYGLF